MNIESATLTLRTSGINTANGDINVGNRNNDCTWNINLQQVLGSMMGKYKRFKICPTSIGSATPVPSLSDANRLVCVNVEGLQWENSSYRLANTSIASSLIMNTAALGTTAGISINYTGETGFVFTRPTTNNVSIRIFLTRMSDDTIQAIQYPNLVYCFSIYGIDE